MKLSVTPKAGSKSLRSVAVEDRAVWRKSHPCGSFEWTVTRVGADIGLRCMGCGRRVMVPREEFERRTKMLTGSESDGNPWALDAPPPVEEGDG